jgi:hypothetical protein
MWILLFFILAEPPIPYTMPFKTETACILVKQAIQHNVEQADEKSPYYAIALPKVNCERN